MDSTKTMNKLTAFLLALPLAAQMILVCDPDCTSAELDLDIVWDKPARKIKKKPSKPPVLPAPVSTIHSPRTAAELQVAIDKAAGGDEIHLSAGLTYSGNFNLPGKPSVVTIRTADLSWSTASQRVKPSDGPRMARVQSPNSLPAFMLAKDADNWHFTGIHFAASDTAPTYNVVQVGDLSEARSLAELPDKVTIERCLITGDPTFGGRRGVLLLGTNLTVRDSHIDSFFEGGADSQAILISSGKGPMLIENNYLEGAGENLFISNETQFLQADGIAENITIRRNHLKKRDAWKPPVGFVMKNLFEIKSARHVLVEANVLENNWESGQTGFGILFTARTSTIPEISDVRFRFNKIINSQNGFAVLGKNGDGAPTDPGRVFDLVIEHNVIEGPAGRFMLFQNGIENVIVRNNTALGIGASIWLSDLAMSGRIDFTGNVIGRGVYGIHHSGTGEGTRSIVAFWREWDVQGNVFVGPGEPHTPSMYPPGNTFVLTASEVPAGAGADMAALNAAIAGVVQ